MWYFNIPGVLKYLYHQFRMLKQQGAKSKTEQIMFPQFPEWKATCKSLRNVVGVRW